MTKEGSPNVFEFTDYRHFLRESFKSIKAKRIGFSENAFIQRAGFGASSRGYFTRIVDGKRNLSSKSIFGFIKALGLSGSEADYFENLVMYNQAQNSDDKKTYLSRMSKSVKRKASGTYRLLTSQYKYLSKWYMVVIREMVALADFREDSLWISRRLGKKISKSEARQALEDLLFLGMLVRDEKGNLKQSEELIHFPDDASNHRIALETQKKLIQHSLEAIEWDAYNKQSFSSIVFACREECVEELREEICAFRKKILEKYGPSDKKRTANTIYNLGIQLVPLTGQEEIS